MFKNKKFFIFAIIFVLVLSMALLAGCGGNTPDPDPDPVDNDNNETPPEPVTLTFAHQWPPQNVYGVAFQMFADLVEEKTNGTVLMDIHPADSLVQVPAIYEAVQDGTVDIGYNASSFLATRMPEMGIFEIPGAFDVEKYEEINEAIHPILDDLFAEHNIKYLDSQFPGELVLASKMPVQSISDLSRKQIRGFGFWIGQALEKLGAVQVTIPPAELNAALERGAAEGAVGAYIFASGYRLYEQAPYVAWPGTQTMWVMLLMNEDSWASLTPDQQTAIMEAAAEVRDFTTAEIATGMEDFKKVVEDANGTNYEFTPAQKQELLDAVAPVFEDIKGQIGPLGVKLLEELDKFK